MPEGDTIHLAARSLRKVLDGQVIASATGRQSLLDATLLEATTVKGIEARGKHLLINFDNQLVLHSHMGMTGSWHIYRHTDEWHKPPQQAFVVLSTDRFHTVCFTPKLLKLVSQTELRRDRYLQRLGPDLLGPPIPDAALLRRFRTQNSAPVGEAVMNQTVVSGIGNVYKSEVLFLQQLHPRRPVAAITDQQLLNIRDSAVELMKRNMDGHMRTTRFAPDGIRMWVYGRQNEPCLKCGTTVQMIRQGDMARSTYFCPACQTVDQ